MSKPTSKNREENFDVLPCEFCGTPITMSKNYLGKNGFLTCKYYKFARKEMAYKSCILDSQLLTEETRLGVDGLLSNLANESKRGKETGPIKVAIVKAYIEEIQSGEPSLSWYRVQINKYGSRMVKHALTYMPYWNSGSLMLENLSGISEPDNIIKQLGASTNAYYQDLLLGYLDEYYELYDFTHETVVIKKTIPIKPRSIAGYFHRISAYLIWLFNNGHPTMQNVGMSVFNEYVVDVLENKRVPNELVVFTQFARKKHKFIPEIKITRRAAKSYNSDFSTLSLEESQETYNRICAYSDPRGRAIGLLALVYAQQAADSCLLKRENLTRDLATGLWELSLTPDEKFAVDPVLSHAFDECIALGDKQAETYPSVNCAYIFYGNRGHYLNHLVAATFCKKASGHSATILRRTAMVNLYRAGEKTMGSYILKTALNVSSPTIHKAIRYTGDSVNASSFEEDAETLRRAFLDDDD